MDCSEVISGIKAKFPLFLPLAFSQDYPDEIRIRVEQGSFKDAALALHKILSSPVMMLFAADERAQTNNFAINAVFASLKNGQWVILSADIPQDNPCFHSLAKNMHSASLFERDIREMFGIEPKGNPDLRRLNLHDEVCPEGNFPLRKDFRKIQPGNTREYKFGKVEGDGVFEVPVGPVHAGIIGPGHFRFSVAGEPIINLEPRLGFTHRGIEKLFEGKRYSEAIQLAECVSGDSVFAHSLAFVMAAEKISRISITEQTAFLRAIFLELERMYNHVNDIGGMALDVGFSFPAALASVIKEAILQLNEKLSASRYLKNVNLIGELLVELDKGKKDLLFTALKQIEDDFKELSRILNGSVSFMDRVDSTGVLLRKTAENLGVVGLVGRASGVPRDLRKQLSGIYKEAKFKMAVEESGDCLARLKVRIFEFEESIRLIREFARNSDNCEKIKVDLKFQSGSALGYAEGWRGPVLYWLKTDNAGQIDRCKIVDPSFHNWQGLSYAVLGNIIPDFPLCNKSFDLSYSGNDL
jgi:Ni,Fe-hydrogenase III large subunit/Ni,Fe-hydrogenase III component G